MSESESRRQSILRIYDALSNGGIHVEGSDVLEEIFWPEAIHHRSSHQLSRGPAGARRLYIELQTRLPGAVATLKRTAVDGEFVAVHWHASTDPGNEFTGESWCEFFRFEGEKVAEHWQLHVAVPSSTVSGRSLFSDSYEHDYVSEDVDAAATAANRETASAAFSRFIDFDHTVIDDHWGEVYLQHSESIPDGAAGLRSSLSEVSALPEGLRPNFTVLVTAADGDLVWFLERVRVGDQTGLGVDIFRLADHKFVEHWDIPAMKPGSIHEGE